MYLYLILLLAFVLIPNSIFLYLNRAKLQWKYLLLSLLILFLIGLLWDQLSVRMGIWTFSSTEIIGTLFGLPIEEYLFFILVPLLSINIYTLWKKTDDKKRGKK